MTCSKYLFSTGIQVSFERARVAQWVRSLDLATHTSLSPIWRGFAPGFVIYTKGCTRLTAASDKVYELLSHGRWFSPGTPASSTTKTGRHDIAEILLKVVLNTINQSNQSINFPLINLIKIMVRCLLYLFCTFFFGKTITSNNIPFGVIPGVIYYDMSTVDLRINSNQWNSVLYNMCNCTRIGFCIKLSPIYNWNIVESNAESPIINNPYSMY